MLRDEGNDIKAAICCPHAFTSLSEHGDEAMQRLRRSRLVLHHADADIVCAGIAAVILLAREITSRDNPHASLSPQLFCRDLAATLFGYVEPKEKTSSGTFITVTFADDLVGEIEFLGIEFPVFFNVRLILIGGDRDILRGSRHLRCCDVA